MRTYTVPTEVRAGSTTIQASQYNTLVRAIRELQKRPTPSTQSPRRHVVGSAGRFYPSVTGAERTELSVSPGCVVYYELTPGRADADDSDEPIGTFHTPIFPTLEGVSLVTKPAPTFDISDKDGGSLWLVVQRHKCGTDVPAESDPDPERVMLANKGEEPEIDPGERAILLCEFDLEDLGDDVPGKLITGLDIRWNDNWAQPYICGGESISDSDSDSDTPGSSSDSDPPSSGSSMPPDSSGSIPDSESMPSSDPDSDSEHPDPDCDTVPTVSFAWCVIDSDEGQPTAVECPPPPFPPANYEVCFQWEILLPLSLDARCGTYWVEFCVSGFEAISFVSPFSGAFIRDGCVYTPIEPSNLSSFFETTFRQNPFLPCSFHDLSVRIRSMPDSDSDPDPCCGLIFADEFTFRTPPCEGKPCTTIVPSSSDSDSGSSGSSGGGSGS